MQPDFSEQVDFLMSTNLLTLVLKMLKLAKLLVSLIIGAATSGVSVTVGDPESTTRKEPSACGTPPSHAVGQRSN